MQKPISLPAQNRWALYINVVRCLRAYNHHNQGLRNIGFNEEHQHGEKEISELLARDHRFEKMEGLRM